MILPKIRQVVTDKLWVKWALLIALYLTYLLHELWTWFAKMTINPFPLAPDQEVSLRYFVFGASGYLIWVVWAAVAYVLFKDAREVMIWFLIFQILEFIEYFITYNRALIFMPNPINPVIKILIPGHPDLKPLGINITNVKIVVMFFLVFKKLFQWKSGK